MRSGTMWFSRLVLAIYLSSVYKLLGNVGASDPTDNCRVVDGDLEYDLSDLSGNDYWHYTETLHTEHSKEYFISVCHPLRNAPTSCPGGDSGVCAVTIQDGNNATRVFRDMGKVPTAIKVADAGRLEYIYDSGEKCDLRGRDETYVTELHLICAQGTSDDSMGPVLMSSPGCSLFFAWMTKAACPKKLEMANATTCMVKFSNSDYILNLHTLHSLSYYNVSTSDESYEVNICGPVTNGHCGQDDATVCRLDKASTPTVMGTTTEMKLVWSSEHLKLLYSYDSKVVEFQFFCERTATSPEIYFVSKNSSTLVFSVKTSVVCTPETPDCVINDDKGNFYDLRSLYKPHGNWKVIDRRDDQQVLYHINMCGEVNDEAFYHCPPGPIGACQTSIGASSAYNMGFLTSHPTVNADGSITVLYTGGDVCKNGQHARSTRINLFCDQKEFEPVLMRVTETCEYIFNWLTPAACPRHLKTGSDCQVTDPLYGHQFDFNSLRNKNKDYEVSNGIHSYLINVCGPLLSKCNGEDTSGVCQVRGSEQFSGGLASSNITFNDGTMVMRFMNGTQGCEDGIKRSTQIVFMCDHEESGFDGPVFIQEESCTYHFIWRTRVACPPFQVVDCTYITENGTFYDLSELSTSLVNEEYYSPTHSKKFVLNVCRSVVHSKESRCPYKAAACIVDLEGNHAVSIGEVSSGPTFEKGSLLLKYPRGDQCKSDPSIVTETIIKFKCDMNALYPYPQLIAEESCKYIFEWATPVACPVKEESGIHSGEDCKVTNPVTGYVFDLSPLKKDNGYDVQGDSGIQIVLNVCDYVKSGKCPGENTGACFIHKNGRLASAGEANADLHYLPGFLFLHYDGGERCRNGLERATLINFVCGAEGSTEGPVLVHDDLDNCTYHINWHTELVCERRINCYVDTWDRRIDLSPLIRTSGNYETLNPYNRKQKFYLNVCRPLNQITGLLCHPGSAACLADAATSDPPLNLGHPMVTPINTNDETVELMYSSGSVCQTNPGFPITTRISFVCDEKVGMGSPEFKEITHDCQYVFEWKTSVVCNKSEEIPDSGPVCQIMYKAAKTNVDLKPLQKSGGYEVKHGDKSFKVNVCGPACSESGVCTTSNESYGSYKKSKLNWDFDKLKLSYFGGDNCSGALTGQKSSVIFFSCDMTAGFGVPVADDIMDMTQCKAVFTWKTNVTCIEGIYKTDAPNTVPPPGIIPSSPTVSNQTDAGKGSGENSSSVVPSADTQKKEEEEPSHTDVTGVIATILVVSGILFVIVLVLFKSERGQRFLSSARRLVGMKGYTDLTQRPAESSSLIGSTSRVFRVDDSDDDLLRV